jgi:serine/threonine-protein kinase
MGVAEGGPEGAAHSELGTAAEPQHAEPQHAEPQRDEPQRAEPQHAEPRGEGLARLDARSGAPPLAARPLAAPMSAWPSLEDTADEPTGPHDTLPASRPPTPDLLVGARIDDRFEVHSLLAEGGMGCVYEAFDRVLRERVALKTLRPDMTSRPSIVKRFIREAEMLSRTESPHIVRLRGFGRLPDGRAYYAMEYLEGRGLVSIFDELGGPMEPTRAIRLALQLATALEHAHALGLVHRDLKPENILVCSQPDGTELLKVLDFGLAKVSNGTTDVTAAGEVVGTPGYMSPEQIRGQPLDARTDIYAFGVVFYEMLTGQLPFDEEELLPLLQAHVSRRPTLPSKLGLPRKLPTVLEWITMCCLYKEPARRFQSARELRSELENAAHLYRIV